MDEAKSFLLSKTIVGIAVALVSHFYGADLGELVGKGVEVTQGVATTGVVGGLVLATIGRLTAKKAIKIPGVARNRGGPALYPKPVPADYATIDPPNDSKRANRRRQ